MHVRASCEPLCLMRASVIEPGEAPLQASQAETSHCGSDDAPRMRDGGLRSGGTQRAVRFNVGRSVEQNTWAEATTVVHTLEIAGQIVQLLQKYGSLCGEFNPLWQHHSFLSSCSSLCCGAWMAAQRSWRVRRTRAAPFEPRSSAPSAGSLSTSSASGVSFEAVARRSTARAAWPTCSSRMRVRTSAARAFDSKA